MNLIFSLTLIMLLSSSCKESRSKSSNKSLVDLEKQYDLNLFNDKPFENLESLTSLYGDSFYINEIYIKGIDTTKAENKIIDIICNSNEIEKRRKHIQRQSNPIQNLTCVIWRKPTENSPFYWIKVLDNYGGNITTHFDFFVRLFPFEILFYDEGKDETIELKIWSIN